MKHDISIIMGSISDLQTMEKAARELRKRKKTPEMRVVSAHRTPDKMARFAKEARKNGRKLIIAGAGGAAHLPGMSASHTLLPVIGVPVTSKVFGGLDSLFSILQMPPGVSVLTVGSGQAGEAGREASKLLREYDTINLLGDLKSDAAKKCSETLSAFNVRITESKAYQKDAVNIHFLKDPTKAKPGRYCVVHCLVTSKRDAPSLGIKMLKDIKKGLWVGVNNGVNAALSAVQILNKEGKHRRALQRFRSAQKQKAMQMDTDIVVKYHGKRRPA